MQDHRPGFCVVAVGFSPGSGRGGGDRERMGQTRVCRRKGEDILHHGDHEQDCLVWWVSSDIMRSMRNESRIRLVGAMGMKQTDEFFAFMKKVAAVSEMIFAKAEDQSKENGNFELDLTELYFRSFHWSI